MAIDATCVHNAHEEFLPISAAMQHQQDAVSLVVSLATRPAQPSASQRGQVGFRWPPKKIDPKSQKYTHYIPPIVSNYITLLPTV